MSKFQFKDPSDTMAGPSYREEGKQPSGIVLHFRHLPTGGTCEFKAFLTDYDDSFEQDWTETDVIGRMDDIQIYKRTKRKISISWTVPSHSQEEAISNFNEISKMIAMQYPIYEDVEGKSGSDFSEAENVLLDVEEIRQTLNKDQINAVEGSLSRIEDSILNSAQSTSQIPSSQQQVSLLSAPPIFQMKFMNWASTSDDEGLYGRMSDFKFKPNFDDGFFTIRDLLIPMSCECSAMFTVIHTDKLGWDRVGNKRTQSFPYQLNKVGGR